MKKLKTEEGVGFPLRLDDFRLMQDSSKEMVAHICKLLLQNRPYTSGILLAGSITTNLSASPKTCTTTDAVVYFQGEIYDVINDTVDAVDDGYPNWHLTPTEQVLSSRSYRDGVTRPVHVNSSMQLVSRHGYTTPCPEGSLDIGSAIKLAELIVVKQESYTQTAILMYGYEADGGNKVRFRRNDIGNLEIFGRFKVSSSPGSTLFMLPLGFRPAIAQTFFVFAEAPDGYNLIEKPIKIQVLPNGTVAINQYQDFSEGYYTICNTIFL